MGSLLARIRRGIAEPEKQPNFPGAARSSRRPPFSSASTTEASFAASKVAGISALVVIGVVLWLALLWFPESAQSLNLDEGWGLAYARFMSTRAQAGVDYIFTYGPLGYLMVPLYFPGLFWLKYGWAAAFSLVETLILLRLMTRLPSRWLWAPFVALVLTALPHSEVQFILVLVVAALSCALEERYTFRRFAPIAVLLATLALVKFTFLVLGVACVAVLIAFAPQKGRRRSALVLVTSVVGASATLWIAAGQSLRNVPRFLWGSLQIAGGYSTSMGIDGPFSYLSTSLEVLVFLSIACLLGIGKDLLSRRKLAALAIIFGGLLLGWKEGFVRQGGHNASLFFGYAAFFPALLLAIDDVRGKPTAAIRSALLAVACLLSIGVLEAVPPDPPRQPLSFTAACDRIVSGFRTLTNPLANEHDLGAAWVHWHKKWNLRAVRARVGSSPIDVVSFDQSTGIWNDFNWHSRPVIQGYAAYTPALAALNGDFFRRSTAPRFVLTRFATIDEHFVAADDPLVLLELLRNYRPVLKERRYILLERRKDADESVRKGRVLLDRRVRFGETIALTPPPDGILTLSVKVSYTFFGALRKRLYWVPPMSISVKFPDSTETKATDLFPEIAASEFLISPYVADNGDLSRIYDGRGKSVAAVRLEVGQAARACFGDSATVVVTEYPRR
jgi:hypothetical protein